MAEDAAASGDLAGSGEPAGAEDSAVAPRNREPVSPARARAADQTVKRATSGLIRLESRRRTRTFLRRSFYLALLAAPIAALIYFFADDIVDVVVAYWERIEAKLPPADASDVPRR